MIYISLSFLLLETISHPNSSFEPKYNSSFVHPFSSHPLPLPPLSSPLTPRYSHLPSTAKHQSEPLLLHLLPPLNPSASLLVSISYPINRLLPASSSSPCPSPTLQFLSLLPFSYFTLPIPPSLLFYLLSFSSTSFLPSFPLPFILPFFF